MLWVAHVAVVAVAAFAERAVDAVACVGVELLQGLHEHLWVDANGLGQGLRCCGAVQVAGVDQCLVVHRLWPRQAQAVAVHRLGVADQPAAGDAFGEHGLHEVVVGIGFVDEASPVRAHRDHAWFGAVGDQVREAFMLATGMPQFGNRCPEEVGHQAFALGRGHGLAKAQGSAVIGGR